MLPNKLQHGDSFARMFDLYNQLIDHLRETRLVAGPGVSISRLPSGTVINAGRKSSAAAPAPAGNEYNGYFKIVNVSTAAEHKIMVVDGDTWNAEEQTSGVSICRVNGSVCQVDAWASAAITRRFYVVLQYHADGTGEAVKIRLFHYIPPDRMTIKFYQIGEVYLQDGALKIIQRHTGGEIALTGGLSTAPFGISPILAEPPESGVFPSTAFTIRVNAGTVKCGSQYIQVAQQDFSSPAPRGDNRIYIIVTVTVSQENPTYSATLNCSVNRPSSVPDPNWIQQIGSCSKSSVVQSMSGNIVVSGVWV